MCHQQNSRWPSEIRSSYWNIFKLKFDRPHSRDFFSNVGVKGVGGQLNFEDIRRNELYGTKNITFFPGITLAPDCYWPEMNPAHLMFAFGVLYEWGLNPPPYLPKFDRLSLLRCPSWSDFLNRWQWGALALEAAMAPLLEKGYFGPVAQQEALSANNTAQFPYPAVPDSTAPFPYVYSPHRRRESESGDSQLVCFETMYVEQKWSVFFEQAHTAKLFQHTFLRLLHKRYPDTRMTRAYRTVHNQYAKAAKEILGFKFPFSSLPPENTPLDDSGLAQRCKTRNLRIFIQQRPAEFNRIFLNGNDVWKATLKYTNYSLKYEFDLPSADLQIAYYNTFDILVATTGSHFTNLILTNRSNVAVLEVGLAIRDWFWRDNARRLGIKSYFFSHIGHTPSKECYAEGKVDPKCHLISESEDVIFCPPPSDVHWHPIGDCSFTVNITQYEKRLQSAIDSLCAPYVS